MADEIVRPKTILSLDEARAAIEGKKSPQLEAMGGMKRNADKEFVLTTSLTVATGVAERVYNLMSEQQAEGLAKVEFMCMQHVERLRQEIEGRTPWGRVRRLVNYLFRRGSAASPERGAVPPALKLDDSTLEGRIANQRFQPDLPTCECHGVVECPAAHGPGGVL